VVLDIRKKFGWHLLAKEISDYTGETFFKIMDTPVVEVAGLYILIHYSNILKSYNHT
jgi:hypothetical protein